MIQFQKIRIACFDNGRNILSLEFLIISTVNAVLHLFLSIIIEESTNHSKSNLLISLTNHILYMKRKRRNLSGNKKTFIFGKSLNNSLRARQLLLASSCTLKFSHYSFLLYLKFVKI